MATEKCAVCLLGAMDRLWFHQVVLFSEPSFSLLPQTPNPKSLLNTSKALEFLLGNNTQKSLSTTQLENSAVAADNSVSQNEEGSGRNREKQIAENERPNRLTTLLPKKNRRSHSSSPTTHQKGLRKYNLIKNSSPSRRLQKTMSLKSLWELELEEVKGFMDLGFIFNRESLSKQIMSLIPGLQRLQGHKHEQNCTQIDDNNSELNTHQDWEVENEEERGVIRPYLSEAWLIKRPDSPLLNLRVPRVSTAAAMKKHLKYWARTVAFAIQQES